MKYTLALLLAFSQAALAGGWGSTGGGELFKDAKNPWFVRSADRVRYCVHVDEATVSVSARRVRELIADAFRYWQNEFNRAMPFSQAGSFSVATQALEEVSCIPGMDDTDGADMAFKIGYGTLNAEQIKWLSQHEDPRRYLGVSVRTSYDEAQLKAKGFVFVASDIGPNAYLNPTGTLVDQAWKHERLLYYVFLHELGHIFGVPHTGSGLMSEVFLDQMLNKSIYQIFTESPIESFLFPDSRMEVCGLTGPDKSWFGVPQDTECVAVAPASMGGESDVLARKTGATDWTIAGTLRVGRANIWDIRNRPAVYLQLNPAQKVFSGEEAAFRSFMIGAQFVDFGAEGVYTSKSESVPRSVYLRFTSGSFQMLGQQSGKVRIMFNYNSLISAKLLIGPNP